MPYPFYSSLNYSVTSCGGGVVLANLMTKREVFFQPGDDAATVYETIDALTEVPESKREAIFDIAMAQYF